MGCAAVNFKCLVSAKTAAALLLLHQSDATRPEERGNVWVGGQKVPEEGEEELEAGRVEGLKSSRLDMGGDS